MDKVNEHLLLVYHVLVAIIMILLGALKSIYHQIVPHKYRSKSVKGEVILVTGAGSGLGKLMSKKFAAMGARLVLVDVDQTNNEKTASEILNAGGEAKSFTCDLSKKDDIYRVAEEIKRSVGDITFLVNNAGIVTGKKFLESSDAAIERTMQVNTMAHFWLSKAFLPSMIDKNHGHIVTIASIAGMFGVSGLCDYCSSKFGAVGFEESLRNELSRLGKDGVKTTLVCPYYINTGMFEGTKSEVLPFLDAEYVADKIIEAVLTDQKVLFLPKIMYWLYFFKGLVSAEAEHYVSKNVLKTISSMDNFVGRQKTA